MTGTDRHLRGPSARSDTRASPETSRNPQYQIDALTGAGCSRIYEDRMSGKDFKRAGLDQALASLRAGDELVVWKRDRVGRTMWETMQIIMDLDRRGIGFRSSPRALMPEHRWGGAFLRSWRQSRKTSMPS